MSRGRTAVVVEMVEVRRARREAEHSAGSHGPGGRRGNAKGGEERGLRVVVARWWLAGLRRRESRRGSGRRSARGATGGRAGGRVGVDTSGTAREAVLLRWSRRLGTVPVLLWPHLPS